MLREQKDSCTEEVPQSLRVAGVSRGSAEKRCLTEEVTRRRASSEKMWPKEEISQGRSSA